jgi:hypothetical protein
MKTLKQFVSEQKTKTKKPNVYKRTTTEYYTTQRKSVNPYTGSAKSTKSRKVSDWVAVVGDKKVGGHGSKKSAIATWHELNKNNSEVKEELTIRNASGKPTKVKNVPIRMADGTIKNLPPGKSGSSGGGGD